MSQLLKPGQVVTLGISGAKCQVKQFLGEGTQGEVHRADLGGKPVALKWYFPEYLTVDEKLQERIRMAIERGSPSDRFLWPIELASAPGLPSFGYIMPLREPRFKSIIDMMKRRIEPSFRAVSTAGFELAHSYLQLHAKGLCYRDISFGNVFFDPGTGEVRICDNDNVDIDGNPGPIRGTPRFMAPEIVRNESEPNARTDLFSLAVLLFHMFVMHHPLEGKKEAEIHALDHSAMCKLYGTEAIFIFDQNDTSNRPVPGIHDNALAFWPIYPQFLLNLFMRAFTDGIRDSNHGRVRESEWREAMIRLRDSIVYCGHCGAESFYDMDALKQSSGVTLTCWACRKNLQLPPRIRIGDSVIMLNCDTQLYPHHIDSNKVFDFSKPVAAVTRHPNDPNIWGLKNLSGDKWVATKPGNPTLEIEPGRSLAMAIGTRVNFGNRQGEIRL